MSALRRWLPGIQILALVLILALARPTPASPRARPPERWGYFVNYDRARSLASLRELAGGGLDGAILYLYGLNGDGTLQGGPNPEAEGVAREGGMAVWAMVKNRARYADFRALLLDPQARERALVNLEGLADAYDGVHLDLEGISAEDRPLLTAFVAEAAERIHARGKGVSLALPAKPRDVTTGWAGAYDYPALAPYLDWAVIMAYDYHGPSSTRPGPISPLDWVRRVALYAAETLGPEKVLLGVNLYGYDWNVTAGGRPVSRRYDETLELMGRPDAQVRFDEAAGESVLTYTDEAGQRHELWFSDARSVQLRWELAVELELRGIALWRLGHEGGEVRGFLTDAGVPRCAPVDPRPGALYFPQTGHNLEGIFRSYWESRGGLYVFGYPRTEVFYERNPEDGRVYAVQYFERARFEHHPELAGTPYEVLLGHLGRAVTRGRGSEPPFQPVPDPGPAFPGVYFPETGHTLQEPFLSYWRRYGGLYIFGYPISEVFQERNPEDGQVYAVQYFERARFEYHPELAGTPYEVLLGLLGNQILRKRGCLP